MIDEPFDLPLSYQGKELSFPTTLRQTGYTHRFEVNVYGDEIFFERDEEGTYRAIAVESTDTNSLDRALLQAIAEAIEKLLQ